MKLEFRFENPHTDWATLHVFKKYYEKFILDHPNIEVSYVNSSHHFDGNSSGIYSAHSMCITNLDTKKYIIITYWDRPIEMTWDCNGWDSKNMVELIASSGTTPEMGFTPFSYIPYNTSFDTLSKNSKKIEDKPNNELIFRGYLYGDRLNLSKTGLIKVVNSKIPSDDKYFEDLTNNKICLSLNGAGEICNRDIEILCSKSVLLRPKLKLEFHNKLIPDYHYISFEHDHDPLIQSEIILNKYNEIKDNIELLKFISENGYQWYLKNGTVDSNVRILQKIINIKKLK
jgi:hypothetical protein